MGTFLTGSTIGWMSPALRSLQSNTSHIKLTSEEGSWLALYPEFGHFMAPVLTGYITDVVGRKAVFIIGGIFTTIGWSLKVIAGKINFTLQSYGQTRTGSQSYWNFPSRLMRLLVILKAQNRIIYASNKRLIL